RVTGLVVRFCHVDLDQNFFGKVLRVRLGNTMRSKESKQTWKIAMIKHGVGCIIAGVEPPHQFIIAGVCQAVHAGFLKRVTHDRNWLARAVRRSYRGYVAWRCSFTDILRRLQRKGAECSRSSCSENGFAQKATGWEIGRGSRASGELANSLFFLTEELG